MKTAPAGTPIITGQGRLLDDMLTGAIGGFGSAESRHGKKKEEWIKMIKTRKEQ